MPIVSFFQRLTWLFLFTGRSYKLSCVTSIRHDLQLSTRAQFTLTTSIMCRTNVVGLIYMTRSVVKSWRMLVAHDSRKQISCRLNRPLLWRSSLVLFGRSVHRIQYPTGIVGPYSIQDACKI